MIVCTNLLPIAALALLNNQSAVNGRMLSARPNILSSGGVLKPITIQTVNSPRPVHEKRSVGFAGVHDGAISHSISPAGQPAAPAREFSASEMREMREMQKKETSSTVEAAVEEPTVAHLSELDDIDIDIDISGPNFDDDILGGDLPEGQGSALLACPAPAESLSGEEDDESKGKKRKGKGGLQNAKKRRTKESLDITMTDKDLESMLQADEDLVDALDEFDFKALAGSVLSPIEDVEETIKAKSAILDKDGDVLMKIQRRMFQFSPFFRPKKYKGDFYLRLTKDIAVTDDDEETLRIDVPSEMRGLLTKVPDFKDCLFNGAVEFYDERTAGTWNCNHSRMLSAAKKALEEVDPLEYEHGSVPKKKVAARKSGTKKLDDAELERMIIDALSTVGDEDDALSTVVRFPADVVSKFHRHNGFWNAAREANERGDLDNFFWRMRGTVEWKEILAAGPDFVASY